MTVDEAKQKARAILKIYPDWILSGSLALILSGDLPPRPVKDLDWVSDEPEDCTESEVSGESGTFLEDVNCDVYFHPKVFAWKTVDGLPIVHPKLVWYYKNQYGRPSDVADSQFSKYCEAKGILSHVR